MTKTNNYKNFLSAGFRLLAKIFIKINKEKKDSKKISRRIKKKIKKYLYDFEKKFYLNKKEKKSDTNILLNATFKKFLYLAKFPFKKKQNQIKTLSLVIIDILTKEISKEEKIIQLENFLDLIEKTRENNFRGNNEFLLKLIIQKRFIKKNSDKNNENNEKYNSDNKTTDNIDIFNIEDIHYSINEKVNKNNIYYDNQIIEENMYQIWKN